MKSYKTVPLSELIGETIIDGHWRNAVMDRLTGYSAYTLKTESGREFVVWNSYGEVCLNEIVG